ncbi:serine/threonine-protein kinase 32C isoform f [Homo sapiens]|uniref:serine/threonine-protein kinase 32C isoform f n=1 Tax=Homo sapiens TaxID=9606 RepID=UPI0007427488|nr:serine/threonine-protein kinase 32C isoform f [Homo sapiens]|eukprot:NP_001305811.1 serine/threonine-protein kinase 32C isoform f [Homo sapiens]
MLSAVWGAGGPGAGGAARGQPSRKELLLRHHLWSGPRCLSFPLGSLPASLLGLPGATSHRSCLSPNLASGLAARGTQTQSVLFGEVRLPLDGGVRGARKRRPSSGQRLLLPCREVCCPWHCYFHEGNLSSLFMSLF